MKTNIASKRDDKIEEGDKKDRKKELVSKLVTNDLFSNYSRAGHVIKRGE